MTPAHDEAELLGGRLRLLQPQKGHRIGTDAMLLAACLPADAEGDILDMGAGVGTIGLALAIFAPRARVGLIERDETLVPLIQENILRNQLHTRVTCFAVDALNAKARRSAGLHDESAQMLFTNPPFYEAEQIRPSPSPLKQQAYVMDASLDEWMRAACALLAPRGTLYMIHRPEALGRILNALNGRFGEVTIKPVHAHAERPATRLLVRAVKGSRAPMSILPGLTLHESGGFTQHGDAIQRGQARITMYARPVSDKTR